MTHPDAATEIIRHDGMSSSIRFLAEASEEVDRAMNAYPPINNVHEGYAIILEELEEFWQEAKLKPELRDPARMRAELIQVAAMACRTAVDAVGR